MLTRLLASEDLPDHEREAFQGMLERMGEWPDATLSPKQGSWARDVFERLELDVDEGAQNLWSSGKVPRGKPVETPPVLLNRPLKPPTRRTT